MAGTGHDIAMGQAVRDTMRRLADELGECAKLQIEQPGFDYEERLSLVPRNPASAPVYVEHDPDSEKGEWTVWVTDHDNSDPLYEEEMDWLETVTRAAADGRVTLFEGAGRVRIEIEVAEGDVRSSTTHEFLRGILPAPGWKNTAKVTRYEPYT